MTGFYQLHHQEARDHYESVWHKSTSQGIT